jgi:hypothetical protein
VGCENTGLGYVKLSHKMYFTDLSKEFLNDINIILGWEHIVMLPFKFAASQAKCTHLYNKNSHKREYLPDNTIQQLQRETIWYHNTPTKQQNRRTPTSPTDIQQHTAPKATTRPKPKLMNSKAPLRTNFI